MRAAKTFGADEDALSVYFECQKHVLSMSTRYVEQLVLADDLRRCRTSAGAGAVPVVQLGTAKFAAWNLGRMFELPASRGAWILLRLTHEGAVLPMALAVDRCLLVAAQRDATVLPSGLFRARAQALWATFPTAAVADRLAGAVSGLCLDPLALWTRAELDQSAAALVAALPEVA
jgi:hypothetical protein